MISLKTPKSRRLALFIAATDVAVLGLALHFLVPGDIASLITDALFTVLVYLLLALILPQAQRHWLALSAFAISAGIEIAQLTGVPAQLAQSFPPARLVFGTTFSAPDLVAYAVGAVAVYYADKVLSRRGRTWLAAQKEIAAPRDRFHQ
ncbi:DUF2809 domain-containing protein [Arthrobacter sp. TMN-49]